MTTNTHDGQRRLTGGGTVDVTTYTAWDASGRPTAGTQTGVGHSTALADDPRRWRPLLDEGSTTNGAVVTATETYDADGILFRRTQHSSISNSTGTRTTTIRSTAQACK